MTAPDLWTQFSALIVSADDRTSSAIRLGPGGAHLLTKGQSGEPVLLLACHARSSPRTPIRLKHVAISFDVGYEVESKDDGVITSGRYCRLACSADSQSLHPYFVEALAATAGAQGAPMGQLELDSVVDSLLELFRRASEPPRRTVQGLWAELLVIHESKRPEELIAAWHSTPYDAFDFSFPTQRYEVKATEHELRQHEFSLGQVRAGMASDFVASVVLTRSATGPSVLELTRAIAAKVSPSAQDRLWRLTLETLGEDAEESDEVRFDLRSARESTRLLECIHVPAPSIATGDETVITDVRFKAQLAEACAAHGLSPAALWG